MKKTTRKQLVATLMASGAAVLAQPGQAATLNSAITFPSAQSIPSSNICFVLASFNVTGTQDDTGTGSDQMYFQSFTPSLGNLSGSAINFANGSTQTITRNVQFNVGFAPREPHFAKLYDLVGLPGPGQGITQIGQGQIPRSVLIAAGGNCLAIAENAAPTANAGADQLLGSGGGNVTLNGSGNDGDGDALTYQWAQVSGPAVALSSTSSASPSFTAPAQVNHAQSMVFRLTTTDGIETSLADDVTVSIPAGPNTLPVADAGTDRTITGGPLASLNGSATDADNDPLTYQWSQVSGPTATITNPTNAAALFAVPASNGSVQTLVFQLVANDGFGNSAADTVTMTIPANLPPTVDAGVDVTVPEGSQVVLGGTATDPENNPLTYQWTQTGGTPVTLTGATTLNPSFTAPPKAALAQVLTFSLIADDGTSASAPDTVDITIPGNQLPNPSAGPDQTVNGGQTITLNGGGSNDPDGDPLTYSWIQIAGPTVTLSGANTANPTFVAPAGGAANQTLTFMLRVSDPLTGGDLPTDLVDIVVLPNSPPVADAGADQGPINTGSTVTLNGNGSTDPDGNQLSYTWTQVSGPAVTLINPTSATPSFVAPNVTGTQNLVFQLVVNDGSVDSPPDTVTIAVRAVGTITVVQRVVGADGTFSYSSDVTALSGSVVTVNGSGTRVANLVPAGSHSVTAGDARGAGYALTSIVCNDSDSVVNLTSRTVAIALSPNENLVCTFTSANTRDAALTSISNFLTARNAALLANRPDLQRRLDRLSGAAPAAGSASIAGLPVPGSGHLPVSVTMADGRAHAATSLGMVRATGNGGRASAPFDLWAEAYFASLDYSGHRGSFRVVYTGADWRISPDLLLGGLVQFDNYTIKGARTAGSADGHGWLAGPYLTARLGPSLYVDARAAWGRSDNTVSPLGTYVDPFKTARSLYSGSLIGQFDVGAAAQFRPEFTLRYLEEKQQGYTDSYGVLIPEQTVGQGDISFRPRFHYTATLGNGWALRPYAEAEGIYTFGLERQSVLANEFRMRLEGGADLFSAGGFRAGLSAFRDGIGSDGFKSTGAHISVSFGF